MRIFGWTVSALAMAIGMASIVASANAMNAQRVATRTTGASTQVRMVVDVQDRETTALDILFVIDDSGSMGEHQKNLLANIDNLVKAAEASGLDLQAGVVTTTVEAGWPRAAGELVGTPSIASTRNGDFRDVLKKNLQAAMTTNGGGTEQPFQAIKLALSEPMISTSNKGFLRTHAGLAIFVLTDADDQSAVTVAEFAKFLKDLKPGMKNAIAFNTAYIPTADTQCSRAGEPAPARIEALLAELGVDQSTTVGLCDADYGAKLAKIGTGLTLLESGIRNLPLKLAPIVGTVKMQYGTLSLFGGDLAEGWVYEVVPNQFVFGPGIQWGSQPKGTKLIIDYTAK